MCTHIPEELPDVTGVLGKLKVELKPTIKKQQTSISMQNYIQSNGMLIIFLLHTNSLSIKICKPNTTNIKKLTWQVAATACTARTSHNAYTSK